MLQVIMSFGIFSCWLALGLVGAVFLPLFFVAASGAALAMYLIYLAAGILRFFNPFRNFKTSHTSAFADRPKFCGPRVLIIDDDLDTAIMTASVLQRQGCVTEISTGKDESTSNLALKEYDFILLDWLLGRNLNGRGIIEGANKMIERRRDLREKFKLARQKVITYSVLASDELKMPDSKYFEHYAHWQKPLRYNDLAFKTQKLFIGV